MKELIQVEIRAFAFSNTPVLQYSKTPKKLAPVPAKPLNSDLASRTRFSMLNKKGLAESANPLILLARLGGFEPPTYGLEVRCSIQLSYRRSSKMSNYACKFHLS